MKEKEVSLRTVTSLTAVLIKKNNNPSFHSLKQLGYCYLPQWDMVHPSQEAPHILVRFGTLQQFAAAFYPL